jgi:hypothetical protein
VSSPDSASVRWGPEGGPTTTKPVSGDEFDPTGLSPNTTYTFQVQVCDAVTCSPWSDPLSLTTGAADSENVLLRLVPHGSNGQCKPHKINGNSQNGCIDVGSASLDAGGVLTTSVTVPPSTAAGEYDFEALRNGGSQTVTAPMPLTVIKQGIQPPAVLSGWDASANRPIASAQAAQGGSLTLHGESFVPGSVSLTLDSANGKVFGQAQAGLDGTFLGTFSLPYTSVGKHTLAASGAGGSRATFEIYVESSVQ